MNPFPPRVDFKLSSLLFILSQSVTVKHGESIAMMNGLIGSLLIFFSLVLTVLCASPIIINAVENDERVDRKLANIDYSGVISIDCGVNESYTDHMTNMQYQADDIQFGQINDVSPYYTFYNESQIQKQLISLRSFPDGKRNCYTLKPRKGKNKKYLIRTYFAYGNYDNQNKLPIIFDLHLGVNVFAKVQIRDDSVLRYEAIHFISTDTIDFCLINIDQGVPFISLLEMWPSDSSIYQTSSTLFPLYLNTRVNLGVPVNNNFFIRYTDDIYGRSWFVNEDYNKNPKKTSSAIDVDELDDPCKLPTEVLSTAVEALNLSNSLKYIKNYSTIYEYYVYLHFFDFEDRAKTQKRIMNITINGFGDQVTQVLSLAYWKPESIVLPTKRGMGIDNILIEATSDSDLPAMLNAFEIYSLVGLPYAATQQDDVAAIRNIRDFYKISKINWQGDPCGPKYFTWEGLTCSGEDNPRIISLNLRSWNLSGGLDASFSNLKYLETLDLSNNLLTGEVPEFFAELPRLKILDLSRNNLKGSIPESLKAKSNNPLQLSLDGNPGLCQTSSCKSNNQKSIVTLVASIAASVAVLIIVIIVMVIWRLKKNGRVTQPGASKKDEQLKWKNQAFRYSEVLSITNDFNIMIGKGGFGKVYLGILQGGKRVAVKILSLSSMQGYKEFKSEAKLLMLVHHRNVVSLVGYCEEGDIKALIYEYLPGGNLQQMLSEKNPNVLEWNERLQIALDAANGLDYLHNGCKPPIIHRDLKPSNILLDENMRAKISDFGLSRTFVNDIDTHVSTSCPAGTLGYLDPEFQSSRILSKKSDVYSFGIVLLQLITGQPAIRGTANNFSHILPWVNLKLETGDIEAIVDPRLHGKYNTASAWKFIEIAMSCLPPVAIQRPDISHIASELKDCLSLEISIERSVSNRRNSYIPMQVEFNESEIGPNPR